MSKIILTDGRAFYYAQILGTLSILLLGMTAAIALVIGAFWLASQFVLLVVFSMVGCFSQLGATWMSADSFTRLLMLVCIALAGYWIARKVKRNHHA